jgi:hypothetical protein
MGSAPEAVRGQEWDERKHFSCTAADSNREALKKNITLIGREDYKGVEERKLIAGRDRQPGRGKR